MSTHFTSSFLVLVLAVGSACAADWPMWRYDAGRSASSPDALPEAASGELHLRWTRQLPAPRPAWPNEPRLHFDAAYQPIVLGQRLFVAAADDGSVAAYETDSGRELWRYYTNGPVRLAPAAWRGKVFFGSDDGYLYCVAAADGSLVWKVRGAPADRPDYRHLGNGRLVSFWPVRGGPVVHDGVVYFGAGIWPTLGVYVRAVDAETGRVVWTNSNSHAIENVRIDHNYLHESGISPQGHLLIAGDRLIVPSGRSMPARLNRKTGDLQYFVQGYRNGDSRVTIAGDLALVGENGVISLQDGREIASRWASAGQHAPAGWSSKKDLFEGPFYPYKFLPGCDHRSVIHDKLAYGVARGVLYAYDIQQAATSLYEKLDANRTLKPARWDAPLRWKLNLNIAPDQATHCIIKAGNRIYGHVGKTLFAVELPAGEKSPTAVAWTKPLAAEPKSLLAGDGKLFVATADGGIHCFSAEQRPPQLHQLKQQPLADVDADKPAASIIKASQVRGGYAVVLGLVDGHRVESLLRQTSLKVVLVDDDAAKVNALRRRLVTEGAYGDRFEALVGKPGELELPPYLASLLTAEDASRLDLRSADAVRRLFDILRPYGGTACFELPADQQRSVLATIRQADLPGAKVEARGNLVCIERAGALPGAADWTHETGDAARSFYSRDGLVRAPLAVLWYGDGPDHGFHKRKDYGHGVKPQVAGGRLFALQIATGTLHAVDAYTGRLLWTRKVGPSARYASLADAVYVADGCACLVIDPANGEPRATFAIDAGRPEGEPVSASDIRVADDVILVALRFNQENAISKGRWNSTLLAALDRASGRPLWSRAAKHRYNTAAIAVGGGRVYCIDSHSPMAVAAMRRRGEPVGKLASEILALDARTGEVHWQTTKHDPPAELKTLHFMGMRTQDDWLAFSRQRGLLLAGKADKTYALDAATGEDVWEKPMRGNQPLILGPETFINQAGHTYDVQTGKLLNGQALFRRGGCNYAVGNKNLLFLRSNCAAYVDIENRRQYNLRSLRSGCSNSLVAADGLLNVPCFSVGCVCNYPIQTSFAMRHLPEAEAWHGAHPLKQQLPGQAAPAKSAK